MRNERQNEVSKKKHNRTAERWRKNKKKSIRPFDAKKENSIHKSFADVGERENEQNVASSYNFQLEKYAFQI